MPLLSQYVVAETAIVDLKMYDPAAHLFSVFPGGAPALAAALGKDRTWVWRWAQPKEKGGTGGKIPTSCLPDVLDLVVAKGLPLTAADLIRTDRTKAA